MGSISGPSGEPQGRDATGPKISLADARRVLDGSPFAQWWGFTLEGIGEGEATMLLPFRAEMLRPGGFLQGGASMALADAAFWLALMTVVGEEPMALTLEMKTNFLRGARGDLRCRARVLKAGRRIVYGEASTTERDVLVAHHTLTYMRAPA
ncbi:MAG: PaaI family thioesterase [Candidatus Limnocylindria bacterium]